MPVLPNTLVGAAQKAAEESAVFEAYPPGVYIGRLEECKAGTATSGVGNPIWALKFDQIHQLGDDGKKMPGRQFTNLTLIDSVMWKVGQFFAAFGVPSSTNTDNLVGHFIRLDVGQRIATQGKRNGQLQNEVNAFMPPKPGDRGYNELLGLHRQLGVTAPWNLPAAVGAPASPVLVQAAAVPVSDAPAQALAQAQQIAQTAPPAGLAPPANDVDF